MIVVCSIGAFCIASAVAVIICHERGANNGKFIFKLVASLLFCLEAVASLYFLPEKSTYGLGILLAMVFGLVGDIMLCLDSYTGKKQLISYVVGGVCFLAGHIAYLVIFLTAYPLNLWFLFIVPFFPLLVVVLSAVKVLKIGKLTLPVAVYSIVLGLLVAGTASIFYQTGTIKGGILLLAAVLFSLSDICLCLNEFGGGTKRKIFIRVVMLAYYSAQVLFAISILL